ncbi:MAG: hypothetical protein PHV81_03785 [Candidatus Methanomethylophilaceae archaeon]|jgi:hypothetical protein|nr:hypothetical protein [Candidatus Methanomethylophilaceae archaeon]MDD2936528.1 hypothetical protein [Candidatus Methanomethylophilaceae archaeon]MDD3351898.1 hypothetical protein [Candidatus Methanomethylophilaceae archaeon]MDD3987225.1 hypothetical protein [Candidatus Methanomethylophilaceae archaeon]MDD4708658.1 hypothetical protein [Candidatus Methanomethylophilaceae archaeon]
MFELAEFYVVVACVVALIVVICAYDMTGSKGRKESKLKKSK